jgi:hypothetical protein
MGQDGELRCHQIQIRRGKLEELRDGDPVVAIPLGEIVDVRITRGLVAERPLIQVATGLALTAIGVLYGLPILSVGLQGRKTAVMLELLLILCLALGPLVVATAFRRGLVLRVQLRRETRKLHAGRRATVADLAPFIDRARSDHGLAISADPALR